MEKRGRGRKGGGAAGEKVEWREKNEHMRLGMSCRGFWVKARWVFFVLILFLITFKITFFKKMLKIVKFI